MTSPSRSPRPLAVVLPTFATFDFAAFPTVSSLTFLLVGIAGALLRVVQRRGGRRAARPLRHRLSDRRPATAAGLGPASAPRVHGSAQQRRER